VSVEALGLALLGRHEDVAQARLTFAGGLVANLSASRVSSKPCRQMQVWADEAMASIDLAERTASVVRPGPAVLRREVDVERLTPDDISRVKDRFLQDHLLVEKLAVEDRNAIGDELEDFVAAIQTGRPLRVDGRQGRAALAAAERVLDAIAHHRWEGRADGPIGPQARPRPTILRGPHWRRDAQPAPPLRREAG
jgi:predicted dehydrogenase